MWSVKVEMLKQMVNEQKKNCKKICKNDNDNWRLTSVCIYLSCHIVCANRRETI